MLNYRRTYGAKAHYFTEVTGRRITILSGEKKRGIGRGGVFTGTCVRGIMMGIRGGQAIGGGRRGWGNEGKIELYA